MAQQLIEQWHLAVLRVQLDVTEPEPAVVTELVSYTQPVPRSVWIRRHPLDAFGLNSTAGPPGELRVPFDLTRDIGQSLYDQDLRGQTSLWLRLVPPYGYLGAVPWETALLGVTDVPLLRVPDRLPQAIDPGRRWSVAIGLSAYAGSNWSGQYILDLSHAILESTDCEIDVFADAGTVEQLNRLNVAGSQWLHIHQPTDARPASRSRSSRMIPQLPIQQAAPGRIWADWIATGLAGRAVRALHVVLDATWDFDRAVLALCTDPDQPSDPGNCTFVSAEDVARLGDDLGGATLSFGAPPDATSETAMRVLVDALGQQRPGATIFSSIKADPTGSALAAAHGFLAGENRPVPRHPSMFAYLQPQQVRPSLVNDWPDPAPEVPIPEGPQPTTRSPEIGPMPPTEDPLPGRVLPSGFDPGSQPDLDAYYASAETIPTWVAASERYIGSQLAHLSQPAETPESVPNKQAYEQGAAQALAEIQALVAKHARPS